VIALGLQLLHTALMLALAPLLTGLVRKVKARLQARRGPGLLQPYRDLARLLHKDAVVAVNASWLFRVTPYLVFTVTALAVSLVPSITTDLPLGPAADLIALARPRSPPSRSSSSPTRSASVSRSPWASSR
jgi:formate hydrogenlyase subunit 4